MENLIRIDSVNKVEIKDLPDSRNILTHHCFDSSRSAAFYYIILVHLP